MIHRNLNEDVECFLDDLFDKGDQYNYINTDITKEFLYWSNVPDNIDKCYFIEETI